MSSTTYDDPEFGTVRIRRLSRSKSVRIRVMNDGTLTATMPKMAPVLFLRNLIDSSRTSLRQAIDDIVALGPPLYHDGDLIGSAHHIVQDFGTKASAKRRGQAINWTVPAGTDSTTKHNQDTVRRAVRKALDVEAKAYLPRRLEYLALPAGFHYSHVRYSNAKGRWGSCSSHGVISLNVALMNLPKELIDYVLVHELSHTRQLNHSAQFWQLVESWYPNYKDARKKLKNYSPYL